MSRSDSRPSGERVRATDFVAVVISNGFTEVDAARVWRRVVELIRKARYTPADAMKEFVTRGQLKPVGDGSKSQFPRMTDADWGMFQDAARDLTKGL